MCLDAPQNHCGFVYTDKKPCVADAVRVHACCVLHFNIARAAGARIAPHRGLGACPSQLDSHCSNHPTLAAGCSARYCPASARFRAAAPGQIHWPLLAFRPRRQFPCALQRRPLRSQSSLRRASMAVTSQSPARAGRCPLRLPLSRLLSCQAAGMRWPPLPSSVVALPQPSHLPGPPWLSNAAPPLARHCPNA